MTIHTAYWRTYYLVRKMGSTHTQAELTARVFSRWDGLMARLAR